MENNLINVIIIGMMIVCVLTGYKKGALVSLKWVIGIAVGLLATPLFSNFVITILSQLGVRTIVSSSTNMLGSFSGIIAGRVMQILAFSIILFASKCIVNAILPNKPSSGAARVIDGIGGAIIGMLQVCAIIWLIDLLTAMSPINLPISLTQSSIFSEISNINGFAFLYSIFQ